MPLQPEEFTMCENDAIVIALSGGMDSATLLGLLHDSEYDEIHCCMFDYGSKHGMYEQQAALKLIDHYQTLSMHTQFHTHIFNLTKIMRGFKSNLLLSNSGEIPEGYYTDETMSQTVVPARNTIFASIMTGVAMSVGAPFIALGVHAGDHHIYADCRPEYIKALDSLIYLASEGQVEIFAPFLHEDKTTILKIGYNLLYPVPYHLTRTCYKSQPISCGVCGSCSERLEAFAKIGVKDPIEYEYRPEMLK